MINIILIMDFSSSNRESLEKILLNPLSGLSLLNLGFIGFVVTFHFICKMLLKTDTENPIRKTGDKTNNMFAITLLITVLIVNTDNPPML